MTQAAPQVLPRRELPALHALLGRLRLRSEDTQNLQPSVNFHVAATTEDRDVSEIVVSGVAVLVVTLERFLLTALGACLAEVRKDLAESGSLSRVCRIGLPSSPC
jgi:hypothetical protein